jgi:hypothetical protein
MHSFNLKLVSDKGIDLLVSAATIFASSGVNLRVFVRAERSNCESRRKSKTNRARTAAFDQKSASK